MNHIAQQTTYEARAERLDAVAGRPDTSAAPSTAVEAVEYGSGWYHDAAIVAPQPAPAQKH